MKTAIQEAIEIIQLAREGEIDQDFRSVKYRIEKLLEKEKEQILSAFQEGYNECENNQHDRQLRKEDYFIKTFHP